MEIDEKAKAYDEMVQRVKELHETGNFRTKKQMEIICPELAESEDEKIRRTLVEYFGPLAQLDLVRGVPIQKIRDWLERQKINNEGDFGRGYDCGYKAGYAVAKNEMKPKVATATLDSEKQKEPHYTKRNALFDKCVENCDPEVMKRVSDEIDEMLEKEQKPEEIDGKALLHVSNKSYDIGFRDGVASVRPVGWSEEQKERSHFVMQVLSDGHMKKAIEIYPDECDCKAGDVVKAIIKKD